MTLILAQVTCGGGQLVELEEEWAQAESCVHGGGTAEPLSPCARVSEPLDEVPACGLLCAAASRRSDCLCGHVLSKVLCQEKQAESV